MPTCFETGIYSILVFFVSAHKEFTFVFCRVSFLFSSQCVYELSWLFTTRNLFRGSNLVVGGFVVDICMCIYIYICFFVSVSRAVFSQFDVQTVVCVMCSLYSILVFRLCHVQSLVCVMCSRWSVLCAVFSLCYV